MKKPALDPKQLYKSCNTEHFHFDTTDELEEVDIFIGQERAVDSIEFGVRVDQPGYNIFALAPSGTGKLTTIQQLVRKESSQHSAPPDWCYVNNFNEPEKPQRLRAYYQKSVKFPIILFKVHKNLSFIQYLRQKSGCISMNFTNLCGLKNLISH